MKIWFDTMRYQYVRMQTNGNCNGESNCESKEPTRWNSDRLTSSFYRSPCQEDLSTLILHRLSLEPDLYIQPCGDIFWLVCHPTGSGQIAVMDASAFDLLQAFQSTEMMHIGSFDELQAVHLFVTLGFLRDLDAPNVLANAQLRPANQVFLLNEAPQRPS
jgi:hypothetical protein